MDLMMHQPVEPTRPTIELDDRPRHDVVIQKDEITNLKIDLETRDSDEIFQLYFS